MRVWLVLGLALAVLACVTEVELLAVVVALTCFPWPRARQHKALLLEAKTALLARHQGKAAGIRTDLARTVPLSVFSFSFPLQEDLSANLLLTSSHILLKTKFSKLLPFFIFSFFPTSISGSAGECLLVLATGACGQHAPSLHVALAYVQLTGRCLPSQHLLLAEPATRCKPLQVEAPVESCLHQTGLQ